MALDPTRNSKSDIERLEQQSHTKKSDLTEDDRVNYIESHSDCLARILFIFAKLNKGITYVQGMNEVLAVLYYCFWKYGDDNIISKQFLESDVFFCFSNLMSEIKDGFLRDLDNENSGIQGKCKAIEMIVKKMDLPVYNHL